MPTVSFRCTDREKFELEDRSDGDMSTYIKARLFGGDDSRELLQHIANRLDEGGSPGGASPVTRREAGMLAELLLLMRLTVKPETVRQAQAEVERLGLEVWSSK